MGGLGRAIALSPLLVFCACASAPSRHPVAVQRADSLARVAIASERDLQGRTLGTQVVAVLPFDGDALPPDLDVLRYGLADLLTTDLAASRSLQVVERIQIDALLRELALSRARSTWESGARLGRLVGAGRIVVGTLSAPTVRDIDVDTRIANTQTGEIAPGAAGRMSIDRIIDAEKSLVFALHDSLGVRLTPAERESIEQRRTEKLAALVAYSRGVRDELFLDFASAARNYQVSLRSDPSFRAARDKLKALGSAPFTPLDDRGMLLSVEGISPLGVTRIPAAADPAFNQRAIGRLVIPIDIP